MHIRHDFGARYRKVKIIGFAYEKGEQELILKSDSSLLNNRKPFFTPDNVSRLAAHPCLVLRVSRLGKEIAPRFALRYVDAFAAGLHLEAANLLEEAQQKSHSWVAATAFDGTLPVGDMLPLPTSTEDMPTVGAQLPPIVFRLGDTERTLCPMMCIEEAVSLLSRSLTLRQGDLLFICGKEAPFLPAENEAIEASVAGENNLYCKIK